VIGEIIGFPFASAIRTDLRTEGGFRILAARAIVNLS
jgi:hypothetical protein